MMERSESPVGPMIVVMQSHGHGTWPTRDIQLDRLPAFDATLQNSIFPATILQFSMKPALWFGRRSVDSD
jgi:hypothetical protein